MPEFIVATPLTRSYISKDYKFSNGISVRSLSPILWDRSLTNEFVSKREKEELINTVRWLCVSKLSEDPHGTGDELYETCVRAMYAMQIICPSYRKNIYLEFQVTDQGLDDVGSHHLKEMSSTLMGRLIRLEEQKFEEHFEAVCQGVERAFQEKIVRLQNPILLLEHGMQLGNYVLSTLFFVMGLDMIYMAGESKNFCDRINGFLSPTTLIFPPAFHGLQPKYQVAEVVSDLYEFRNHIAHGREIPKYPFREKHDFLDLSGQQINSNDYHYGELLCDSALFLLCKTLRKIFVEELVDEIRDVPKWRRRLRMN